MGQVNVCNLSGGNGSKYITTTAVTEDLYCIQFLSESVVNTLTGNMDGTPTETFDKGDCLYGRFTYVYLTSGSAVIYLS